MFSIKRFLATAILSVSLITPTTQRCNDITWGWVGTAVVGLIAIGEGIHLYFSHDAIKHLKRILYDQESNNKALKQQLSDAQKRMEEQENNHKKELEAEVDLRHRVMSELKASYEQKAAEVSKQVVKKEEVALKKKHTWFPTTQP